VGETIPALLFENVDRSPDRVSIYWAADGGVWKALTTRESAIEVARLARGMADRGVGKGTCVAILSDTRREWNAVDFATLCLGGVTLGIYPSMLADAVIWQLRHGRAKVLVVENAAQAAKVMARRGELPDLEHVVSIEPVDGLPGLASWRGEGDLAWLRGQAMAVQPGDTATIIYTSGTTGLSKGVVLTHGAFVAVAKATIGLIPVDPGDRSVVFLPLAHSFQRFTVYRGLLEDVVGYYAESLDKLPEALVAARPQILASVPRMLEKIRAKVLATVDAKGGATKRIFDRAFAVGKERIGRVERKERVGLALELQWRFYDRLVFSKIRERLGGQIRVLVSGGAALDPEVARWYGAMGIIVLEGWGLSETCAPATCNTPDDFRFGTVGKPIPGVEVRIADDGEILVRGPGLFAGYFEDAAATAEVVRDGWFYTGDIGEFDRDGFLKITDRKKELIVTAGGKNIAPVPIEKRIERGALVGQAMVIGSEKPYLVALLVPDDEALAALAKRSGWPDEAIERRLERAEVRAALQAAVDEANAELARFEQVKKWAAVAVPFSIESGELTPTLKLKRRVVSQRHAAAIAALYG